MTARARRIDRRPSARQRGYGTKWETARATFLAAHPRCERDLGNGRLCNAPSSVVHHVTPHKGNRKLFWSRRNWSARCKACHDGPEQRTERLGYDTAVDANGLPADPRHPFNASER